MFSLRFRTSLSSWSILGCSPVQDNTEFICTHTRGILCLCTQNYVECEVHVCVAVDFMHRTGGRLRRESHTRVCKGGGDRGWREPGGCDQSPGSSRSEQRRRRVPSVKMPGSHRSTLAALLALHACADLTLLSLSPFLFIPLSLSWRVAIFSAHLQNFHE